MLQGRLPEFITQNYECHEWKHASAILSSDYPAEWQDIVDVLSAFRRKKSWVALAARFWSSASGRRFSRMMMNE